MRLIPSALAVVAFSARMMCATYYVDSLAGSDTNSGRSTAAPWKTIAKVNVGPYSSGDSILFHRGSTWSGPSLLPSQGLTVPSSGSMANPITFGAYGTGPAPVIDGTNTLLYLIQIINQNYVTIQDLALQNARSLVGVSGGSNVSLLRLTGRNASIYGYLMTNATANPLIDHSSFSTDVNWRMNGWAFRIDSAVSGATVTNNICDLRNLNQSFSDPACIDVEDAQNADISRNYTYGGTQGVAIKNHTRSVTGGSIFDNYIWGVVRMNGGDSQAIELTGTSTSQQISGISVYRNVVIGSAGTAQLTAGYHASGCRMFANVLIGPVNNSGFHFSSGSANNRFFNNTVSNTRIGFAIYNAGSTGNQVKNNILDNLGTGISVDAAGGASATEDYNDFNTNVRMPNQGAVSGGHSVIADPKFRASAPRSAEDVKLESSSPAIGAGTNLGPPYNAVLDPASLGFPYATVDQSTAPIMGAFGYTIPALPPRDGATNH
jgi:hypothetical protein